MKRLHRVQPPLRVTMVIALLAGCQLTATAKSPRKLEFNRDIRPILAANCFACHGPDARKREAGLRLDDEKVAKSPAESGSVAIVPGKSADSELVVRITSTDPDVHMPPADSGKQLTATQIDLLRTWIDQGAGWEGHWSFLPLRHAAALVVAGEGSARCAIDAFVNARLDEQGLVAAAEADRVTLIRRLSWDLLGLPPAPEEVAAFVHDPHPQAYERLVDRLLASPHFGERMAVFWLDLVRYADSVGYHGDQPVSVSPFRDYVINAFNADKPFDQFTVEQLAGDLLPTPTLEQRIASGYNRLGMMSAEGGVQDKEYLAKYIAERVRNVSGVWLGVTLGCCECHDHKFDPFPSRDFYQLESFFADVQEKGFYNDAYPKGNWGPSIAVPTDDQAAQLARFDATIAELDRRLGESTPELVAAQAAWERSLQPATAWTVLRPEKVESSAGATLKVLDDQSILATGERPDKDTYVVACPTSTSDITALRLEVLPDASLPKSGPGRADNGNFVLTEIVATWQPPGGAAPVPIAWSAASASFEQSAAAEKNPYKAWTASSAIDADAKGTAYGWAVLGETGLENLAVFTFQKPLHVAEDGQLVITLQQQHGNGGHTLGRFRLAISSAAPPVTASGAGLSRTVRDVLAVPAAERSMDQQSELAAYYRTIAPLLAPDRAQRAEQARQREALQKEVPTTLVTVSVPPRTIRILPRGNWMDDSGPIVEPHVPAILPQPSAGRRLTRLDLAQWLVRPDNPLTARVLVNRLWKVYFGAGISRKLDDLGAQGEWPTHPQLLDWLAAELIASGWDVKHLVRTIVTSDAYRRSSVTSPAARDKDPDNRWLARQGRFRLDAEFVRDTMLQVSGLLVPKIGGVSVFPYQPPGYWAHLNFPQREWQNSTGEGQYRRGLYTHWQRQYLHPSLLAFDAPSRESCTAERVRSNTPLQSLVLLNDPSYIEAARALAERTLAEGGGSTAERLNWAARRVISRNLRAEERRLLEVLLDKHLGEYRGDIESARKLVAVGQHPPAAVDPVELAAWMSVTRLLLNLHETVTRN